MVMSILTSINISSLLLVGALFSAISFVLGLLILRKVFEEKYRRPWLFISLSVILFTPAQILRFFETQDMLISEAIFVIYGLEFVAQAFLMYALLLEFFILKFVKGKFVKMRFIPVQEGSVDGILSFDVTKGEGYLAHKKDRDYLFRCFKEATTKGYEGFMLTTKFPYDVRKEYGLVKTPILMITDPQSDETISDVGANAQVADALHFSEMIRDIDYFYSQSQNPFIFIEIDEILKYSPFDIVFELLQYLKAKNSKSNGILIISIYQDSLNYFNLTRIKQLLHELE
ncbi:MAG: DUF835 domain-containing protein [Candidatus Nanoarchaeia archaeon]